MSWDEAGAGALFGGGVLNAIGSIQEGNAAKAAADQRRQELATAAQLQETAAAESSASRLMDLQRTVGNIRAITAARGLSPNSPSAMAITANAQRLTDQNVQREGFNARQQSESLRLAGRAAGISGNAAQTAGYLKGVGSFFKSAADAGSTFL